MLGVVQQVAKDIGDVEIGSLATFDAMFAGIRASLKSAAQRSIDRAERDLPDSGSLVKNPASISRRAMLSGFSCTWVSTRGPTYSSRPSPSWE